MTYFVTGNTITHYVATDFIHFFGNVTAADGYLQNEFRYETYEDAREESKYIFSVQMTRDTDQLVSFKRMPIVDICITDADAVPIKLIDTVAEADDEITLLEEEDERNDEYEEDRYQVCYIMYEEGYLPCYQCWPTCWVDLKERDR